METMSWIILPIAIKACSLLHIFFTEAGVSYQILKPVTMARIEFSSATDSLFWSLTLTLTLTPSVFLLQSLSHFFRGVLWNIMHTNLGGCWLFQHHMLINHWVFSSQMFPLSLSTIAYRHVAIHCWPENIMSWDSTSCQQCHHWFIKSRIYYCIILHHSPATSWKEVNDLHLFYQ
jgi:hypothetical protein